MNPGPGNLSHSHPAQGGTPETAKAVDETVIRKLLGWHHSGFSLHNAVRIGPHDAEGWWAVASELWPRN